MSNQINDGGAAFPSKLPKNADQHLLDVINSGMSLRDYFAGEALPSLLKLCAQDTILEGQTFEQHVALFTYSVADAMIEARNQDQ